MVLPALQDVVCLEALVAQPAELALVAGRPASLRASPVVGTQAALPPAEALAEALVVAPLVAP